MPASTPKHLLMGAARHLIVTGVAVWVVDSVRRRARSTRDATDHHAADAGCPAQPAPVCLPDGEDWLPNVHREIAELNAFAGYFEQSDTFGRHEGDMADDVFVRLDDLRWLLADYVLHGARVRRLVELPVLVESILGFSSPNSDAQGRLRATAHDLLSSVRATNEVMFDWLLTHRVVIPDPDFLDSNALLDRYRRMELEPQSVSSDPLYLLVCLIHDALEAAEQFDNVEDAMLERFEAQLTKPLAAIELEIAAAVAFNNSLVGVFRDPHPTEAA
ncbi:hypothetical protein FHT40_002491 [Mycolicibacterium sp. BK556]|uniref:hypothetical protein n=1 Tax=unclassified Mycolicibacterium TaxID=2636767 RepID=UPI0016145AC7|nr:MULTISPECIES: hypothetical protein [unclassified Mycolicibacterium]MBB3602830.1 hypothetical protein [Mycolicibacterium sp. BK556]MBB3633025.1 hypothetical protein [Mycolicibacterium sp. BK607]